MGLTILLLIATVFGCAMEPKVIRVPVKEKVVRWADKKRECHTFYLDKFGLSKEDTIGICKEELER